MPVMPQIKNWVDDPEFQALPDEDQRSKLANFFERELVDDEFYQLPEEDRAAKVQNFVAQHVHLRTAGGYDEPPGSMQGVDPLTAFPQPEPVQAQPMPAEEPPDFAAQADQFLQSSMQSYMGGRKAEPAARDEGYIETIGTEIVGGLAEAAAGAFTAVGSGATFLRKRFGTEEGATEVGAKKMQNYFLSKAEKYTTTQEYAGKNLWDNPELIIDPKFMVAGTSRMIPSMAAAMLPGGAALKFGRTAAAIVGGASGGLLEGVNTYRETLERGGTTDEAFENMIEMTVGSGLLNAIGLGKIFSKAKGGKRLIKGFADALVEGITEYLEEPTELAILAHNVGLQPGEITQRLKDGLAVIGPAMIMGGGGSAVSQYIEAAQENKAADLEAQAAQTGDPAIKARAGQERELADALKADMKQAVKDFQQQQKKEAPPEAAAEQPVEPEPEPSAPEAGGEALLEDEEVEEGAGVAELPTQQAAEGATEAEHTGVAEGEIVAEATPEPEKTVSATAAEEARQAQEETEPTEAEKKMAAALEEEKRLEAEGEEKIASEKESKMQKMQSKMQSEGIEPETKPAAAPVTAEPVSEAPETSAETEVVAEQEKIESTLTDAETKQPWEMTREELSIDYGSEMRVQNNSMKPWKGELPPVGSWRLDTATDGLEQLQWMNLDELTISEPEEDIKRHRTYEQYVKWAKEGKQPPPINVVKHTKGHWVATNRRRVLAARDAGLKKILAWVSDTDEKGHPFPTHKSLIEQALERGDTVPAEVLADYPDLAEKYEEKKAAPGQGGEIEVTGKGKNKTVKADLSKKEEDSLTPKAQKAYLLDEIETAIKAAKRDKEIWEQIDIPKAEQRDDITTRTETTEEHKKRIGQVVIEVPGDGKFTVLNTKENLAAFQKQVQAKFPATPYRRGTFEAKPIKAPNARGNRIVNAEYYNPFSPRQAKVKGAEKNFYEGGFYSDTYFMVKMDKRPVIKGKFAKIEKKRIEQLVASGDKAIPAKIIGEMFLGDNLDVETIGERLDVGNPLVHAVSEGGDHFAYMAENVDIILTEHPTAKPYMIPASESMGGALYFKKGKAVVGSTMPLTTSTGEGIGTTGKLEDMPKIVRQGYVEQTGEKPTKEESEQREESNKQAAGEKEVAPKAVAEEEGESIESEGQLRDYAKERGWKVTAINSESKMAKERGYAFRLTKNNNKMYAEAIDDAKALLDDAEKEAIKNIEPETQPISQEEADKLVEEELERLEEERQSWEDDLQLSVAATSPTLQRLRQARPGMPVNELETVVRPLRGQYVTPIKVVAAVDDLPASMHRKLKSIEGRGRIVRGVFDPDTGIVWLIGQGIGSPKEAVEIVLHEAAGHYGLRAVVGAPEWFEFMDWIARSKEYGPEVVRVAEDQRKTLQEAAEEWFAIQVEASGGKLDATLWQKFVYYVRQWLRRRGINIQFSEPELRMLMMRANEAARRGPMRVTAQAAVEGVRFGTGSPQGEFYRQMQNVIENKLPGKGTAASYRQAIESWAKKGEYKSEELEWSGLLDDPTSPLQQSGKLDRQQVVDWLEQNNVRVEEVRKGEGANLGDVEAWWNDEGGANEETPYSELSGAERQAAAERYQEEVGDYEEDATKFSGYQLPGGENYREILITLPKNVPEPLTQLPEDYDVVYDGSPTAIRYNQEWSVSPSSQKHGQPMAGRHHTEDDAIAAALLLLNNKKIDESPVFTQSHWPEANVLVHLRLNDRVDADGKRVLFVEEVQSDWHQKGRKEGYDNADKVDDNTPLRAVEVQPGLWEVYTGDNRTFITNVQSHQMPGGGVVTEEIAIQEARRRVREEPQRTGLNRGIPNAPFKTTWPLLGFKKALRIAAEEGYDSIAWTTGETQAERYDLSKQLDKVSALKEKGGWLVNGYKDGTAIVTQKGLSDNELPDFIGKELADKIIKQQERFKEYSGLDLKVGGEGLRAFYDVMLPNMVNKYVKKWGARVGLDIMSVGGTMTNHVLTITPAMRQSALMGQPLFATYLNADYLRAQYRQLQDVLAATPEYRNGESTQGIRLRIMMKLEELESRLRSNGNLQTSTAPAFGYREDNPGGDWLEEQQAAAAENFAKNHYGTAGGAMTANFEGPLWVPLNLVDGLPGVRGEQIRFIRPQDVAEQVRAEDERQIVKLVKSIKARSFDPAEPIMIWVEYNGMAFVAEGNHRLRAAMEAGIDSVPVEIRYFAGGEQEYGQLHPAKVMQAAQKARQGASGLQMSTVSPDDLPRNVGGRHQLADKAVQGRIDNSWGIKKPSWRVRAAEVATDLSNKARREYEYLPKNEEFAQLRFDLLRLAKQKGVQSDATIRNISAIIDGLDPDEYYNFSLKVMFDDFAAMIEDESEIDLPFFGRDHDKFRAEYQRLNAAVEGNQKIAAALDRRARAWTDLKAEYIDWMAKIGFNVEKRLTRKNYFRHQVLEFAQVRATWGTGKKLKTPSSRGFLKERQGSERDINSQYIEAEHEVMAQMSYDIEVAKTIHGVDVHYNLQDTLKMQAAALNEAGIVDHFRAMVEAEGEIEGDTDEAAAAMYRKILNTKQAIGLSKLGALAAADVLPEGPGGKWTALIDALKAQHESGNPLAPEYQSAVFPYLQYLVRAHAGTDYGIAAATVFKGVREKREYMKDNLGDKYVTWRDLIPTGYTTWQPREGNLFYLTDTIPANIANRLLEESVEEIGIKKEMLRKALAQGGRRREFVIKDEVAATLDELVHDQNKGLLLEFERGVIQYWKRWQLLSPRRFPKYNIRNLTGDADAAFAGNPRVFKFLPQAVRDLWTAYRSDAPLEGHIKDWFDRGGQISTLQAQEMGELTKLKSFVDKAGKQAQRKGLWRKYWRAVRLTTDFREALLRYAAYLEGLDQWNTNDRIVNYGASKKAEIDGLSDPKDKAYWLANDLLGAYDRVGVMGQHLRAHWFPFWSWKEVNLRRYIQIFRNAAENNELAGTIGRKLAGTIVLAPYRAIRIGKLWLKTTALLAIAYVINRLVFPDDDDDLPEGVRDKPHITLGRDSEGNVRYFSRIGALGDLLEWVNLDAAPKYVNLIMDGKMSPKEAAKEMLVKQPINVFVQGLRPFLKLGAELTVRRSLFPDLWEPRTIRDRGLHTAQAFGLEKEYIALTGKPERWPYLSTDNAESFFLYKLDPAGTSFWQIQDESRRFLKDKGYTYEGFHLTPRGNALYNMKMALRYEDYDTAREYLDAYHALGGTNKGLRQSLGAMHPLYSVPKKYRTEFVENYLDSEGRADLVRALQYYQELRDASFKELPGAVKPPKTDSRSKGPSLPAPPKFPEFPGLSLSGESHRQQKRRSIADYARAAG